MNAPYETAISLIDRDACVSHLQRLVIALSWREHLSRGADHLERELLLVQPSVLRLHRRRDICMIDSPSSIGS